MKQPEIMAMQRRIGVTPDGFFGPKSITACQKHLRKLMPVKHPWPVATQTELTKFYGQPGDESKLVTITFPFPMFYEGKRALKTRVHERCADSLLRVLTRIGHLYTHERGIIEEAEDYGGCYNNRPMRGGSLPSLHARGAAIDLDADDNGNLVSWPAGADMPLEVMEEFAREGWLSAGAFWGRDAMHHQATQ